MRMLITGAAGMLGQDLVAAAGVAGHEPRALARADLDITDEDAVRRAIGDAQPRVVVNCAAWTDVDGAESSEADALRVNGTGAGHVARAAAAAGAWIIQISSDYVFDGSKREPYVESDATAPLSAYGRSKLAGEREVAAGAPRKHTIVRSSWLFGAGGPCFPATMMRLASEREELTVVDDQVGCPTFTGHLARALVVLAQRPVNGIAHVAGADACSWYEFARQIVSEAGFECEVKPGMTSDLARPAPRPAYSVLTTERGPEVPVLPGWREGLIAYMAAAGVGAR
jgi:dTDP-4-dehydrorhamnose reductase